jgi:hypothetical protein
LAIVRFFIIIYTSVRAGACLKHVIVSRFFKFAGCYTRLIINMLNRKGMCWRTLLKVLVSRDDEINIFLSIKTYVELYNAFKELYICAYALLKSKIEVSAV